MKDRTASRIYIPSHLRHLAVCYSTACLIGIALLGSAQRADALGEHDLVLGALQRLDYAGATEILTHLANTGDASAQAALAILMESGKVETDYPQPPLALIRAAADQGLPQAALELGNRHYLGRLQDRNYAKAIEWWRIAAENGSTAAAFNLGLTYAKGTSVTPDFDQAKQWFVRAADSGSLDSRFALGVLKLNSGDFPAAFSDFEQAATAGLSRAQFNLASMYESGIGCEKNLEQATIWYEQAADAGLDAALGALRRLKKARGRETQPLKGICTSTWAFTQNPEHFTVQVAMGTSTSATIKILERYGENIAKGCYPANLNGARRYFALVGSYSSHSDAISFLDSLEPKLRIYNPWIRRFRSIQATQSD
jgi:TPR repeat protein